MSRARLTVFAIMSLALAAVGWTTPSKASLLSNGDFEAASLGGWTSSQGGWSIGTTGAFQGTYYATSNCSSYWSLSQSIETVLNQTYNLSFLYNPGADPRTSGLNIVWENDGVGVQTTILGLDTSGWYSFAISGLVATSPSMNLTFRSYSPDAFIGLDNVVLAAAPAATPLPGALPLFASGAGILGLFGWYRRRKALPRIAA